MVEEVICDICGNKFKNRAGLLGHIRIVHKGIEKQEALPESKGAITTSKTTIYTGEDLGIADMLIKAGYAQNLDELAHKNLRLANSLINFQGGKNMENPKETKEETFEDVEKIRDRDIVRKYKELQVKAMEKEIDGKKQEKPETDDEEKIIRQMERQIRMKTMKKTLDEGDFDFDKMFKYQMMSKMNFGGSGSSEVQALQNQLNLMQQQLQQERLVAAQQLQNERVIQKIEQMNQAQPGLTAQDVLTFTADKEKAVKEMDVKLQAEKEKLTAERLAQLQLQIQQAQQSGGLTAQKILAFNEELKAIKSLASEFGERPKGAGEYFSETITNVANTLQPTLTKLIEQRERQKEMQMQQPQYPPPEIQQPENPGPPEIQLIPSDMTETEKQMSDTMSDMYIRKRKRE